MPTRRVVVSKAREWLGTPYTRGASRKGEGARCDGFIAGAFLAAGAPLDLARMEYVPHVRLARLADVIAVTKPDEDEPQHLILVTATWPRLRVIHAGSRGVEEVEPRGDFFSVLHSIWRHPQLTD